MDSGNLVCLVGLYRNPSQLTVTDLCSSISNVSLVILALSVMTFCVYRFGHLRFVDLVVASVFAKL